MSIAEKIAALNTALDDIEQAKNDVAQAITDKGVDTPAGTSWGDMIENIGNIPSGGGDKVFLQSLQSTQHAGPLVAGPSITVSKTGKYRIVGAGSRGNTGSGSYAFGLRVNGSVIAYSSFPSTGYFSDCNAVWNLSEGDIVDTFVQTPSTSQNSRGQSVAIQEI